MSAGGVRGKVVLAVVIAHVPEHSAGNAWAFLNWALALRDAGWDVWVVEHLDRGTLVASPQGGASLNERLFYGLLGEFGFAGRATLWVDGEAAWGEVFERWAADADWFFNVSGQFKLWGLVGHIPVRVYGDLDPAFTQLWYAVAGSDMNFEGHTHFASVGVRLDRALVPDTAREWIPVLPPVCTRAWSADAAHEGGALVPEADPGGAWTTITHWYGYKQMPWEGRIYGDKRDSLVKVRDLPGRGFRVAVATDLQPDWPDHADFVGAGWRIIPSAAVCGDWRAYRRFISGSAGEVCVAKDGYVVSRCGWMSDRSVLYLACGRPVAFQDTGWVEAVEPRDGLLPWSDLEGLEAVLREFERDPAKHGAGARRIAEEVFEGRKVADGLAARLGL